MRIQFSIFFFGIYNIAWNIDKTVIEVFYQIN